MKTIFQILLFFFIVSSNADSQSCYSDELQHFNYEDIKSIFNKNSCNSCHNSSSSIVAWDYSTYESMFGLNNCGDAYITRGDAGSSKLIISLRNQKDCDGRTLSENHNLSTQEIKNIESWINVGAPKSCIPLVDEIIEISKSNGCNSCHNAVDKMGGWYLDHSLDLNIFSNLECGVDKVIDLYNPERSSLVHIISKTMPCTDGLNASHHKLHPEEITKIADWIAAGAPINKSSLPLELLSFIINVENSHPKLLWHTASEIGVQKFEIERLIGNGAFDKIHELPANGNIKNEYSFIDKDVSYGATYYRIKIIDYDGRHEYSPIEYIDINAKQFVFDVYPNPSMNNSVLFLEWYSKNDIQNTAKMKIMSSSGRVLKENRIFKGTNKISLPELSNGIYYLTIEDYYGGTHYERLIILDE